MGQDYEPKKGTKAQKYEHVLQEMQFRMDPSNHPVSNMSNLLAMLKSQFNWYWIGFYFIFKNTLVLGNFQGPPACTKIFKGHGVCGKCWQINDTIVVKNVSEFEGHIACSSKSQSQIVVPVRRENEFIGMIDIDSENLGQYDEVDKNYLQKILKIMQDLNVFQIWK